MSAVPAPRALLELLKPVTWFPPMWAYACGVVSAGVAFGERWVLIVVGVLLAGPLVCGTSQIVNDWYDRHVDAINEPNRPIPSGRVPGTWGFWYAVVWTLLSLAVATVLGIWGFLAAALGLLLAWAYSAPPTRLKKNGWYGNSAVAICYEGVPWFTGVVVMVGVFPDWRIVAVAVLYSIGAHGIMTLNDFKSIEGDKRMGLGSLPVQLGVDRAAHLACWVMALPQVVVIGLLLGWGAPGYALAVTAVLLAQVALMTRLVQKPKELAPWYNGTGITLYVSGMMVTAFALRSMELM
ncbi:chlorophyll synthase [Ectothiorhodosinus mongolicus]|uniref:Chlorophyll synthase n=1 Tax=Ectothiorhodosinus mongolicus TaxID=233100 RepID=A0A1R3VR11_9GAMM|nr:chlorophyll synthase ChlG [Ectothiorhodosinus mongolicus]ULX57718.1 bacteriochlorophyll/chlorophyll a synthase [Ectothiorhodosinus mongolicus]SIT65572.1 chlorophyll synthase [Ectothiorhodosinus mongolicus]